MSDYSLTEDTPDMAELVACFESLGNDCEFGDVQRHFGAEPLGLFRWSNPLPEAILRALKNNLSDLGDAAYVALDSQTPAEWIVYEPNYDLKQHTHVREGQLSEEAVKEQQMLRFRFLRRTFLEDLAEATKIYVIKAHPNLTLETVLPIAQELRRIAPHWLLWVISGEDVGAVEVVEPGLVRGTVGYLRTQGECFGNFSFDTWGLVLKNTWQLISRLREDEARAS